MFQLQWPDIDTAGDGAQYGRHAASSRSHQSNIQQLRHGIDDMGG